MSTSRVSPLAKRLAALALLVPALGQALPEDRNQPIHIESDSARRDDRDDLVIYEGSVRIDQGTLHIDADKVTVHFANGEADRIVCEGAPAVYRQQQKPDSAPVDARARQIDYLMGQDLVVLTGAARVEQEGSVLEGERITYDVAKEQIQARGDATNRRIRMVIPPKQQPDKR